MDSSTTEPRAVGGIGWLPLGLAIASLGAAGIHFAVMGEHYDEYLWFGVFFTMIAWAQAVWAVAAAATPNRSVLATGLAGNLLIVAIWLVTRTSGLPFGPEPGQPEALDWADGVSSALELLIAIGCLAGLLRSGWLARGSRRFAWAVAGGLAAIVAVVTTVALVSGPSEGAAAHAPDGDRMTAGSEGP